MITWLEDNIYFAIEFLPLILLNDNYFMLWIYESSFSQYMKSKLFGTNWNPFIMPGGCIYIYSDRERGDGLGSIYGSNSPKGEPMAPHSY